MKKLFLSVLFLCVSIMNICAQEPNSVEMADGMHANGKIYVVVTVLSIVFAGIVVFLIMLDRKIAKIEEKVK